MVVIKKQISRWGQVEESHLFSQTVKKDTKTQRNTDNKKKERN
jgi:hypothetical protein